MWELKGNQSVAARAVSDAGGSSLVRNSPRSSHCFAVRMSRQLALRFPSHQRTGKKRVVFPPKLSNRDVKPWIVFMDCVVMAFEATCAPEVAVALHAQDHGHSFEGGNPEVGEVHRGVGLREKYSPHQLR